MAANNNIWLTRAEAAFTASTTYFDTNIRKQLESDLRQSTGKHPAGSKYHSDAYRSRSKLFRPKTRTAIRKNEATAAAAFFSTQDVVNVAPQDENDKTQSASASVMRELLQHRLTKSIPWFQICMGAYQDAMTVGVVASKQTWEYNKGRRIDRPVIDLIPVENIRIDPGAKWHDPIGTSPYVIHMIPMYVKDVKARMATADEKTGQAKWNSLTDGQIASSLQSSADSVRTVREGNRMDSKANTVAINDFTIVWVHENYMSIDGKDVVYYTLGVQFMLTEPNPVEEIYWHGRCPIVMGCALIDTHKIYPMSLPNISSDTQAEINEIANQRIDNVKFAMNKRYFVKRGQQVDLRSLTRNVPSSVTLMTDPEGDVKVLETKDVTASSYQEQDRLNLDFDDVTGNFSQSSVQSNRNLNETVGGMAMLSEGANQISEYQLRTFSETWVEPVLRQLVLLEQYYESDETIIALAGARAEIFQKFGIDAVTDEMLFNEFTITVNVGTGATNPQNQVERFIYGLRALIELLGPSIANRLNVEEVILELFGKLGYKDGKRFFNFDEDDPKFAQLMSTVQELQDQLKQKEAPELVAAKVEKIMAEIEGLKSQRVKTGVETSYAAMQAGQVVATMPAVAPVADAIMQGAGYQDPIPAGVDPNFPQPGGMTEIPAPEVNQNTSPALPPVSPSPYQGIETQAPDGVQEFADGGIVDKVREFILGPEDEKPKSDQKQPEPSLQEKMTPAKIQKAIDALKKEDK